MSGHDDGLRAKLAQVEDDLAQLRVERADKAKKREEAKQAFASIDTYDTDSPEFKAAEAAVREVGEVDDRIADKSSAQIGILKMLGQSDEDIVKREGGNADSLKRAGDKTPGAWNSSELFNDTVKAALERASTTKGRFGGLDLGQVADRDAVKADLAPTSPLREANAPSINLLPQLLRPLRLLDLLPVGTMDGNTFSYVVEGGSLDGATEVVEEAVKPQLAVTFTDATVQAQTIAAWMKLRKQSLADFAALRGVIDNRLRYSVQRRLEGQILAGNGSDPNLRGILNTSGIGAVDYAAGPVADLILTGITAVMLAEAQATGIVMNPLDWQGVLTAKNDSGDYYGGGPFSITPQVLWGVPLIPSTVIPAGTVLVGDFALGAQLFIREGVQVLLSDSDQDDFIRNRVTLLGEMRAALAVFRPTAFATVDLTA
jgi:HK97 family phage major capsid protein